MKDSVLPWIVIALLGGIAYLGKDTCMHAVHFVMALAHSSSGSPASSSGVSDASKALAATPAGKPQESGLDAKEPPPEPGVFFLRAPLDVPSAAGPRHLNTGARVTQVSEDHSGVCTVDDGTSRFTVDFSQLTQYHKVAELLKAKEVAKR